MILPFLVIAVGAAAPAGSYDCPCYRAEVGVYCATNVYDFFLKGNGDIIPGHLDAERQLRTMFHSFPGIRYSVDITFPTEDTTFSASSEGYFRSLGIDTGLARRSVDRSRREILVAVRVLGDVSEVLGTSKQHLGRPRPIDDVPKCTTLAGLLGYEPDAILIPLDNCANADKECIVAALDGRENDIVAKADLGQVGVLLRGPDDPDLADVAYSAIEERLGNHKNVVVLPKMSGDAKYIVVVKLKTRTTSVKPRKAFTETPKPPSR